RRRSPDQADVLVRQRVGLCQSHARRGEPTGCLWCPNLAILTTLALRTDKDPAFMNVRKMTELDLRGKRVLIREDLNVPVKHGKATSDARRRACLPTIRAASDAGARGLLRSHLGRPTEGQPADEFSLAPVADHLGNLLDRRVRLVTNYLGQRGELGDDEVVLLEHVRLNPGAQ